MNKTYSQSVKTNLSELEIETITNFLVRESVEIIYEEVDYFFHSRDNMINMVLDGQPLDKLDLKGLRDKLNKLYTKEEVLLMVQKIEKRIRKEIRMAQWEVNFKFDLNQIPWIEAGFIATFLRAEMKTLLYSTSVVTAVDMTWVKLRTKIVPAAFSKLVSKAKVGELVLATVKANPQKLRADLRIKIDKLIRGSLKQYKTQLCKEMSAQVCNQIFIRDLNNSAINELIQVQTA